MDSIRAREEMTSGGGEDDETLDKGKKKRYNRPYCSCYLMDRSVRVHIPLIDSVG